MTKRFSSHGARRRPNDQVTVRPDPAGGIPHLELLDDLLRQAGHERVVTAPGLVEYGNWETLERYVVRDGTVAGWRGDRGTGDWTGVTFDVAEDAARWITASAAGQLRDQAGLRFAHWLLDRRDELPEAMSLTSTEDANILEWDVGGTVHRARFGAGQYVAPAVQFSTVARVPIGAILSCALQEDSRRAFALATLPA